MPVSTLLPSVASITRLGEKISPTFNSRIKCPREAHRLHKRRLVQRDDRFGRPPSSFRSDSTAHQYSSSALEELEPAALVLALDLRQRFTSGRTSRSRAATIATLTDVDICLCGPLRIT